MERWISCHLDFNKIQIYRLNMKIVFLSRYQNTIERGAEIFVKELAKRLSENNEVDIFAGKDADSLNKVLSGKYDIVIPINGRLQSLKVSIVRIIAKHKLLITGQSGIGWDDILNIATSKPDVFIALTEYQRNWAKKWAWGSKVLKIPNGIDLDKFSPKGIKMTLDLERPIILSVGALAWYKFHEKVIRAVSKLPKGSLLIVGEGEEKERLEILGKNLLGERFRIMKIKYEDMPKVYRSTDLFTLPSWSREAFGIVYLEALASGLGIVAPDDLSRREIIGDAGIFVDVDDADKYADAIAKALQIDWSQKARTQAEKFSWQKIAKQYEQVMLNILKVDQ